MSLSTGSRLGPYELGDRQTISGETGGFTLRVGTPEKLFDDPGTFLLSPPAPGRGAARYWDLAPDGRFLMVKAAGVAAAAEPPGFVHVQNWTEDLKRLVPAR